MIITTTPGCPGKKIVKTLGMVRGSTVRSKHLGKDILAFLRNLVGGEIPEYTKMLAEAREQALDRMMSDAARLGANAIVATRYGTSDITSGAAEILIYGTAVILADDDAHQIDTSAEDE
ncbi:MAG: YbjQ family protein [Candidatus Hydrogenedentes bacterium]|nr:YbjQ family protein [Candidatus Hydrogenedentota bacterium]